MRNLAKAVRFIVRVPVLSVHSTVAEPRVSTVALCRVNTWCFEIRQAPIAMKKISHTERGGLWGSSLAPSCVNSRNASASVKPVDEADDWPKDVSMRPFCVTSTLSA